jgi:hypothetical protein
MKETPISYLGRAGLRGWLAILGLLLFALAFLLIPMTIDLRTHLVWRYSAYLIGLAGVATIGAVLRGKLNTVLLGIAVFLFISLVAKSGGFYPPGTPLLETSTIIKGGLQSGSSFIDVEGFQDIVRMLARFAVIVDAVFALLAVALVGIAAVVLTNAMSAPAAGRTIPALVLVFLLVVPGLVIAYAYTSGIGGLQFAGSLGIGALEASKLVDVVNEGEINNQVLEDVEAGITAAGEEFEKAETLLWGLENMRSFKFLGTLPWVGRYSPTARQASWGLTSAANGLQISALGGVEILEGALTIFNGERTARMDSFDVIGPRLMEEGLNESAVALGILQIDSGFGQVVQGFPRIRSALGNFSAVDPEVFEGRLSDMADQMEEMLETVGELEDGIDVADVMLSHGDQPLTPSTHFILAAYSIARLAPSLTDLSDARSIPSLDNVIANLSHVSVALDDPVVVGIREQGGDTGGSISFVEDVIDLIEDMAELGDVTAALAEDQEKTRDRFGETPVPALSDEDFDTWSEDVDSLADQAARLNSRIDGIEDKINSMLSKASKEQYGYANVLAESGIDLMDQVLRFMGMLRGLTGFTDGLDSLVDGVRSFRGFYLELEQVEAEVRAGDMESALTSARSAREGLSSGRSHAEGALANLESLSAGLELPITAGDINGIIEAAANIDLKMSGLEAQIIAGDQNGALETLAELRSDFGALETRLGLLG